MFEDLASEGLVQKSGCVEIDGAIEDVPQRTLERRKLEKPYSMFRIELYQQIEIARGGIISSKHRAIERKVLNMVYPA